ncbi:MAG: sugar ABC transporter permease [Clostridia bacterium]|nr:sugar ABC transporter permease [Clostridia bacterium]MBQ7053239.1 sugar ABC transporter permease [Clostridia bacterium]
MAAKRKKRVDWDRELTHALFVTPNFILYTLFSVFPIFVGLYYSFTNWDGIKRKYKFVGFRNYVRMFGDSRFQRAVTFNATYVLMYVVLLVLLAVVLGLLLNQKVRARSFFRSAYFFPAVIGMLSCGMIFRQIFGHGLPAVGETLGIEWLKTNILIDPAKAKFGILFVNLWQGVCIPTVLVLAGLQTIPAELNESAQLDGATGWNIFKHITIPFLLPTISMILVLALKESLMIYDYILALTDGGPAGRTESVTMLIMKHAFTELKFSTGVAEAIVLAVVIITISVVQIYLTNRKKVYE